VLDKINTDLDQCKDEKIGVFKPNKVYEMMNQMQRKINPDAYVPEIEKTLIVRE
jgi:hypothetical protein